MSLTDRLDGAKRRGYSRAPGESRLDNMVQSLRKDPKAQKALKAALSDFDVDRGCFRVPSTVLAVILEEEMNEKLSVTSICDYRRRKGFRAEALKAAGLDG